MGHIRAWKIGSWTDLIFQYLNFGLPSLYNCKKYISIVHYPLSLWYFVISAQTDLRHALKTFFLEQVVFIEQHTQWPIFDHQSLQNPVFNCPRSRHIEFFGSLSATPCGEYWNSSTNQTLTLAQGLLSPPLRTLKRQVHRLSTTGLSPQIPTRGWNVYFLGNSSPGQTKARLDHLSLATTSHGTQLSRYFGSMKGPCTSCKNRVLVKKEPPTLFLVTKCGQQNHSQGAQGLTCTISVVPGAITQKMENKALGSQFPMEIWS